MCAALLSLVARADDEAAVSEKLGRIIKETKLRHRDIEHFFVVEVRMSTGYLQEVFVTKQAHFLGEEPFVEITAVGWRWENATEFSRQNANWLLEASTTTKVGGWQALKFEDENSVAAEFKATIPLDSRPQTFEAVIKGVASSAFELHDLMDE
jgi:hypothetical protein